MDRKVDWEQIYSLPSLFRDNCWKSCSSYCCTQERAYRQFSFLGKRGNDIFILPGEMEFLRDANRLQAGFSETLEPVPIRLLDGIEVPLYKATCSLKGICSDHASRPVICRLYPFFPVVAPDGTITDLEPFSLMDGLFDLLGVEAPCQVRELGLSEIGNFMKIFSLLFRSPLNVFLFMAANTARSHMNANLRKSYPEVLREPEAAFLAKWEKLFLMGRLIDGPRLASELTAVYASVLAEWRPRGVRPLRPTKECTP